MALGKAAPPKQETAPAPSGPEPEAGQENFVSPEAMADILGGSGAEGPPEEQGGEVEESQVDEFVDKASELIYGGDTPEGEISTPILDMLKGGLGNADQPVDALANTGATISARVIAKAVEQGFNLDPAAAFQGMLEVLGDLATIAGEEEVYDYSQKEVDAAGIKAGEFLYQQTEELGFFDQQEMSDDMTQMQADSDSGQMEKDLEQIQSLDPTMGGGPDAG